MGYRSFCHVVVGFLLIHLCLAHAATSVTLSASQNPATFGAPVALIATLTPASATGQVTFYDGTTVLGIRAIASGAASLSTGVRTSGRLLCRHVWHQH